MSDLRDTRYGDNPYVGPRPFEEADSDRFFGREKEIRQLASLVAARRVVVLYARSGAGKTSLLKAGLIPHLREQKGLRVLPMARVGGKSPQGALKETVENLYALNALFDLVGGSIPSDQLPSWNLAEGLERLLSSSPPSPCLLILDQLEELFQIHPELHAQRAELFKELQRCLDRMPQLSLLLSLREDAVAELDPHAALFPDRLRSRFRLELLTGEAARQAMQLPARHAGMELSDAVAQRLADELRTIQTQGSDGRAQTALGPWVEPVHLQVICQRLWIRQTVLERQSTAETTRRQIEAADLEAVGSVDDALTGYYDEQVNAVAAATGQRERTLRDWLEHYLITEQGIRGQVLCGVESSQGLANHVVQALVDARLVRAETRRGATWFELAHDRLVAPVRASNTAWRRDHLHPMQHRADLWVREARPSGLLLRGGELRRELAWAKARSEELTAEEKQFLNASRQRRSTKRLGVLVFVVALALVISFGLFWQERLNRQRELARGVAAQATSHRAERLDLALLLSLEANRIDASDTSLPGGLLASLQHQPRLQTFLHGHTDTVWTVAFRPRIADGPPMLASGSLDHRILLWDTDRHQRLGEPLRGHTDGVLGLTWSPDGQKLVSTGRDGRMLLWDLAQRPPHSEVLSKGRIITSAAFREENQLVTGDTDHQILVWDLTQDPPSNRLVGEHTDWITSLAIDPTDSWLLASGGADQRILLWTDGFEAPRELFGHSDWVSGLAFSPDGRLLASASLDRTVRRFDLAALQELGEPLKGPTNGISGVVISPDSKVLAATTANGLLYLWDVATGVSLGQPLTGNLALMRSLSFSPDSKTLATSNGPTIALWDLADLDKHPGLGRLLGGEGNNVHDTLFSPDGSRVMVSVRGENPEIWFLDADTGQAWREPLQSFPEEAHAIAISPDGRTLAEFGDDEEFKEVRLWDLAHLESTVGLREMVPSGIAQDPDRRALRQVGNFARVLEKTLEPRRSEECVTVRTVAFTPDGRALAAEGAPTPNAGKWVERWDIDTGESRGHGIEGAECVRSLAFSNDGELLAVGADKGPIALLAKATLEPRAPLQGHALPVRSLAFSSDGAALASGDDGGIVRLWDLDASSPHSLPLTGHTDTIYALAFDPTGRVLASAGRDQTVILWDVPSGTPIGQPLSGHAGPVQSLAFGPGGKRLISGGEDGLRLWELSLEGLRERACRIANRNLTEEEWNLFVGSQGPTLCL